MIAEVHAIDFYVWIVNGVRWTWEGKKSFYATLREMGFCQVHLTSRNKDFGIINI